MRLNRSQQYAIQWMLSKGDDVTQIVKELKIPKDVVNKFVEKHYQPNEENSVKTTSSKITAKDLMIRQTSAKGNKPVAIMTKEASQTSDEFKKKMPQTSPRHTASIHIINEQ